MFACFDRFEIKMTKYQAMSASHPGACDSDVEVLINVPAIRRQLDKIDPAKIAAELKGYGAWDDNELSNELENRRRIIWIAAGNIIDG